MGLGVCGEPLWVWGLDHVVLGLLRKDGPRVQCGSRITTGDSWSPGRSHGA